MPVIRSWSDPEQLRRHLTEHRIVDATTGCWVWPGKWKYPSIRVDGIKVSVHVIAAFAFLGIPRSNRERYICHHCDNPMCWNPAHLFDGTPTQNVQDAIRKHRHPAADPPQYCPAGHKYTKANTYWHRNHRMCRICRRIANRRQYWRSKQTNMAKSKGWI